jgi:hypothetical protein
LPPTKKTAALRVLAVALVPALRLVPPTATLAKANPRARLPPAGLWTCFGSRLRGAHGSRCLPRVSPRKRLNSSSGTLVKERKPIPVSLPELAKETKKEDSFGIARGKETIKKNRQGGSHQTLESGSLFKLGPTSAVAVREALINEGLFFADLPPR